MIGTRLLMEVACLRAVATLFCKPLFCELVFAGSLFVVLLMVSRATFRESLTMAIYYTVTWACIHYVRTQRRI